METSTTQGYRGVEVKYAAQNWIIPSFEYVELLSAISNPNDQSMVLFHSRVGLARVALLSLCIGFMFGFHFLLLLLYFDSSISISVWSLYVLFLCAYHVLEFFMTAKNHPGKTNVDSFLINHSKAFTFALLASWLEFWVETYFFPHSKFQLWYIYVWGVSWIVMGQSVRTVAMIQAGPSFTHVIAHEKERRHQLVTGGIYSVLRHPAYFGWFYWSIGTQLLLCNPVCAVAYAMMAWYFFYNRLEEEELSLHVLFGDQYAVYKQHTWIGIPGL